MMNTNEWMPLITPLISAAFSGMIGWVTRGHWDKRKEKQKIADSAPYAYTQILSSDEDKKEINPQNISEHCYSLRIEERIDESENNQGTGKITVDFGETTLKEIQINRQMQYIFLNNKHCEGLETKFIYKNQTILLHGWRYRVLGEKQNVSLFVPLFERPDQIKMDSKEYEFYHDNETPDGFFSGKFTYKPKKKKEIKRIKKSMR